MIKVKDIKIMRSFLESSPKQEKLNAAINYYKRNGKLKEDIILNENRYLIDGYTSYLVANMYGIEEVPYIFNQKKPKRIKTVLLDDDGKSLKYYSIIDIFQYIDKARGKNRRCSSSKRKYLRETLYNIESNCAYCGKPLQIEDTSRDDYLTLDHIIPVALGGKTAIGNLQPLCLKCNNIKGCEVNKDEYWNYAKSNHLFDNNKKMQQLVQILI